MKQALWAIALLIISVTIAGCGSTCGNCPADTSNAGQQGCQSNLKKLAAAISMYKQDADERYPLAQNWSQALMVYRLTEQNYRCPAIFIPRFSYGFVEALAEKADAQVPMQEAQILFFEADGIPNFVGGLDDLVPVPRHNGGDNYVFVDGYVQYHPRSHATELGWDTTTK